MKKRHRYVGYEGTCLDCNLDLDDAVHISDREFEKNRRDKLAARIIKQVRAALGVQDGIPGEVDPVIVGWDDALAAVREVI